MTVEVGIPEYFLAATFGLFQGVPTIDFGAINSLPTDHAASFLVVWFLASFENFVSAVYM